MPLALPNELLLKIVEHMPELERAAFSQTSKHMRAITKAVPFNRIRLGEQTTLEVLRIVRFVHQNPIFISATEEIEIDTTVWKQGRIHALPKGGTKKAQVLIESLVPFRDTPHTALSATYVGDGTKQHWLGVWNADQGYLIVCLAWMVLNAGSLRNLHVKIQHHGTAFAFFNLLYHTHAAILELGHQCFTQLEHLEMTAHAHSIYAPLVPTLTEVVLIRPISWIDFNCSGFPPSCATGLRLIKLRSSDRGGLEICQLLKKHALPSVEKIWIEDEQAFWTQFYTEFFELVSRKCPKIHTLMITSRLLPIQSSGTTTVPINANQLQTVTYFGIHHMLLPEVSPNLNLLRFAESVPGNIEELNIQGLTVDSMKHVADSYRNGRRIQMALPTKLRTLHLSFDVNANEFDSPIQKLAHIKPALGALSNQLGDSGHTLQVHVCNTESEISEEKFIF